MSSILVFYIIFMFVLIILPIIYSIASGQVRFVGLISILIGIGLGIYIMDQSASRYDNLEKILIEYGKVNASLNKSYNPHTLKECLVYSNRVKYEIAYQFGDIIKYIPRNCKIGK